MRLVLVIDVADDWAEDYKDFTVDYDLRGTPIDDDKVNESIKYVEDADVRLLPQKMHIEQVGRIWGEEQKLCAIGYNQCLDEILGETEHGTDS